MVKVLTLLAIRIFDLCRPIITRPYQTEGRCWNGRRERHKANRAIAGCPRLEPAKQLIRHGIGVEVGSGEIGDAIVAVGITDGGGSGEETVAVGVGVTGERVGVGVPSHPPMMAITTTTTHSTRRKL